MGAAEELKAIATRQELEIIEESVVKAGELRQTAERRMARGASVADALGPYGPPPVSALPNQA